MPFKTSRKAITQPAGDFTHSSKDITMTPAHQDDVRRGKSDLRHVLQQSMSLHSEQNKSQKPVVS